MKERSQAGVTEAAPRKPPGYWFMSRNMDGKS